VILRPNPEARRDHQGRQRTFFIMPRKRMLRWMPTMISRLTVALSLALFVAGCGKGNKPPPSTATTNATQEENQRVGPGQQTPQAPPSVAGQVTTAPPAEPDLNQLTREVRRWIVRNKRVPQNFEEVFSGAQMQVPPPPAGKKYELNKQMKVILVNR
jgi:hypothetical protein